MNKDILTVFYINTDGTVEKMASTVDGNSISFTTTHFSMYAISEKTPTDFSFTSNTDGTLSVNKYNGNNNSVVIPSELNGKQVSTIASRAFDSLDRLTSIIIPEGIISIGANAFYGCTSVSAIIIPSSVTNIGTSAFYGWTRSQEILVKGQTGQPASWNNQWNSSCNAKITYCRKTIVFNANGGTGTMNNQLADMNVATELNKVTFTKSGYSFIGWSSTFDGNVAYQDEATYTVGSESLYTLYAVWSANTNQVIFDANGGQGSMSVLGINTDETNNLSENTFTKAGYTFAGWATTAMGTAIYTDEAPYTMGTSNSYTLYAVWVANHNSVIFNSNGGEGAMAPLSIDTNSSKPLTLNTFTKPGYSFEGWSFTKNGAVVYADGATYQMDTESSITLYAVWSANNNSLHLLANNGTSNKLVINIETGNTATLAKNVFTKGGYTFGGWSETENGSAQYDDEASYIMETDSVAYLYAVWTANSNTIVFYPGTGAGTMSPFGVKTDESTHLPECSFSKTGYAFVGWAMEENGDVAYLNCAEYSMGTNAEYSLYAIWEIDTYSVNYDLDNGTNDIQNPSSYNINTDTITLHSPERDGYAFKGWFTESGYINEVTSIAKGSTGNKLFFSKWQANENTICFNANGGTGSINDIKGNTDSSITLPKNTFERRGYTFVGWTTTQNGEVLYGDKDIYAVGINANYTLYAVWTINNYSITYTLNGGSFGSAVTQSYTVISNSFVLSMPSRAGYSFIGWTGTDEPTANKTVTIVKGSIDERAFIANWSANTNIIIFNGSGFNGGNMNNQSIKTDATEKLTTCEYTKTGYHFIGWAETATGKVKYNDSASFTMGTNGSYNLYAIWEANIDTLYVVKHYQENANDDEYTLFATQNLNGTSDESISPVVNDYMGFTSPSAQTKTIAADGSLCVEYYYARKTFTLSFEPNGGSAVSNRTLKYHQSISVTNLSSKAGYTFINWCTDTQLSQVFDSTSGIESTTIIYANWDANTNRIWYCTNGGVGDSYYVEGKTDETLTVMSNSFTFDGHEFLGWSTQTTGDVEYTPNELYTVTIENMQELYAIWYEGDFWDGTYTYSFESGDGSQETPYIVKTAEQLAYVAQSVNQNIDTFANKHIMLVSNIDLRCIQWTPIGTDYSFYGNFDGNKKEIKNLYINSSSLNSVGLFGYASNSLIQNVNITDSSISGSSSSAAILVGNLTVNSMATDIVYIDNCHVKGTVSISTQGTDNSVGGICGRFQSAGIIQNSSSIGSFGAAVYSPGSLYSHESCVGGIVGKGATIKDCYSTGNVSASGGSLYADKTCVGGIAGRCEKVENSYSTATVSSTGQEQAIAGGIVGGKAYQTLSVISCFSTGNITTSSYSSSDTYVGRIVGVGNIVGNISEGLSITNCFADGAQIVSGKVKTNWETLQFTYTLKSVKFIAETLLWDTSIWTIEDGSLPILSAV